MKKTLLAFSTLSIAAFASLSSAASTDLFNGKDLSGWVNVNTAPSRSRTIAMCVPAQSRGPSITAAPSATARATAASSDATLKYGIHAAGTAEFNPRR